MEFLFDQEVGVVLPGVALLGGRRRTTQAEESDPLPAGDAMLTRGKILFMYMIEIENKLWCKYLTRKYIYNSSTDVKVYIFTSIVKATYY